MVISTDWNKVVNGSRIIPNFYIQDNGLIQKIVRRGGSIHGGVFYDPENTKYFWSNLFCNITFIILSICLITCVLIYSLSFSIGISSFALIFSAFVLCKVICKEVISHY